MKNEFLEYLDETGKNIQLVSNWEKNPVQIDRGYGITFLKSLCSNEKDEVCHSFLVEIFTKFLHRGVVALLHSLSRLNG